MCNLEIQTTYHTHDTKWRYTKNRKQKQKDDQHRSTKKTTGDEPRYPWVG